MTDIVQRLHNFAIWNNRLSHYEPVPLCREAADEIKRLQPYVDAFRREEDRADKLGREVDEMQERIVGASAFLLSDSVAGAIAVELQARDRFKDIPTLRAMVEASIKAALDVSGGIK